MKNKNFLDQTAKTERAGKGLQSNESDITEISALFGDHHQSCSFASLEEIMAEHIKKALVICGGKIHGRGGAGELLSINPNTLRKRMDKLGIPFRRNYTTNKIKF